MRAAFSILLLCSCIGLSAAAGPAVVPATAEPAAVPAAEAPASSPVPAPSDAANPSAPAYAKPLRDQARKILGGPDFHQQGQSRKLAFRDWLSTLLEPLLKEKEKKPDKESPPMNLAGLAEVIKVVLVILLGLALLWLLWRGWQWLGPRVLARDAPRTARPTREAQTLALADEELPGAISAAARAAWQRGDAVLALSLLYRGAVRSLAEHHRIELPDSATEGECLQLARRSGKAVVGEGFAPIVRAWMALAYARRVPDDFEQLLQVYRRCFEKVAATGGGK
ncbi:MAG: hypothetical protein K0S16_530 [Moraxellaceae bacterium]|nr:hypothetical protein [Moraxellaceae bacterium]